MSGQYAKPNVFLSANLYANYFRDKIEGVWRVYDFQYNFEYRNLAKSSILGAELMGRIKLLDPLMFNFSYSYVNVEKVDGIQINTTSPHTGSLRFAYQYKGKNYKLTSNLSVAITGKKEFSVQDKIILKSKSHIAFFEVTTPTYAMWNFSLTQAFKNSIDITVGVDNFLNYKPDMLGAGVSMFNVPATPGRRFFIQSEFSLEKFAELFK